MLKDAKRIFENRVVKNASWIILCRVAQMLINLVVGMLTARYLGPSNYGLINYAKSVVAFAMPIMQLGLSNILVQEIVHAQDNEGELLGTSMTLSLLSSFFCVIGVFVFATLANRNESDTIIVCMLCSLSLVFTAVELINYWFQAKLLSKYSALVMFFAYTIIAAYRVILLMTGKSVFWFAASQPLDCMMIGFAEVIIYKRLGGGRLSFSWETAKRLFSKSRYYIISSLMVTVFAHTDKIMLKLMINDEDTGYYSAAVTCASLSGFFFAAIIDSMRPSIFSAQKQSEERFQERLTLLYSIVIYLSLLQSLVMTIAARFIITMLYGEEYSLASGALRIVVWYTTFAYLGSVRNIWILAKNKQKYLWIINMSGAIANVVLNFALIPLCGLHGAAAASLITQIFTNVIIGYIIRPISYNNKIMLDSLNPKVLLHMKDVL